MPECNLADVPSLKEANINTPYFLPRFWCIQLDLSRDLDGPLKDVYHVMLGGMLEKFQNVENLTVGFSFLQVCCHFCILRFLMITESSFYHDP